MANYCPNCGFPHNHRITDVVPRLVREHDSDETYESDELQCKVCNDVAQRWMWIDDCFDGDFDWVDVDLGTWILN